MEFSAEQLFNDLRWWFDTGKHDGERLNALRRLQKTEDGHQEYQTELGRFKNHWLGSRCDGKGPDVCATSLWQLARVLCSAPNEHHEIRAELSQELAKVDSAPNKSIFRNVKVWIAHVSEIDVAKKQLELLKFQLHTAHAALLLTKENSTDQAVVAQMQMAMQFAAKPEDCIVPSGKSPQDESPLLKCARLREELRHQLADSDVDRNRLEVELLKLDRGITWSLGGESSQEVSRRLPVPLVAKSRNPQGEVEVGSLAYLRVRTSSQTVADLSQGEATPHLIADPVYCGLMTFDKKWTDCLGAAMRWAVEGQKGSHILFYDLNFPWARLVLESHLKKWLHRQSKVTGGSASLAAGLLAKATIEKRNINSTACVTGCIENHVLGETTMGEISGVIPKLGAFDELITKHFSNHQFICGLAATEDHEAINAINDLNGFSKVQKVKKPQDAYLHITGETDLIRRYAAAEMSRVWEKVGRFIPNRFRERLKAGVGAYDKDEFSFESLSVLEELNIPQTATEQKRHVDKKSEDENEETLSLDSVVQGYVENPASKPCLTLLGAPGIGKTWVGLRWHMKLIQQFWSGFTGQSENGNAKFPIWITVWDIQNRWEKGSPQTLNQILLDLAVERGRNILGDEAPAFREFVDRQLKSNNVFLIVDSWDERKREQGFESESFVRSSLGDWIVAKNPLVITSRQVGETSNPGLLLQGESPAWLINPSDDRLGSHEFAKRWFGEEYPQHQPMLENVFSNRNLDDFCRVPQLVAMLCWFAENENRLPEDLVRPSHLILEVVKAVLRKYADSTRSEDETAQHLVEDGRLYEVLQLLAFRTFGGGRWQVTLEEIENEFDSEYQERYQRLTRSLSANAKERKLYWHLKRCGLFDSLLGDKSLQIVHQTLAEALVASFMVEDESFQKDIQNLTSDYESSIKVAARLGLLDRRFQGVWGYFAELNPRSNSIIGVLDSLWNQGEAPGFSNDVRERAREILDEFLIRSRVVSADPKISQVITSTFLEVVKDKCEFPGWYSVQLDICGDLAKVFNFASQGYMDDLRPLYRRIESAIQQQLTSNKKIGDGSPHEASSLDVLRAIWRVIQLKAGHLSSFDFYMRQKDCTSFDLSDYNTPELLDASGLLEVFEKLRSPLDRSDKDLISHLAWFLCCHGVPAGLDFSKYFAALCASDKFDDICRAARLFKSIKRNSTRINEVEAAMLDAARNGINWIEDGLVRHSDHPLSKQVQLATSAGVKQTSSIGLPLGPSPEWLNFAGAFSELKGAVSFCQDTSSIDTLPASLLAQIKKTHEILSCVPLPDEKTLPRERLPFSKDSESTKSFSEIKSLQKRGEALAEQLPFARTLTALLIRSLSEDLANQWGNWWCHAKYEFPPKEKAPKPREVELPGYCLQLEILENRIAYINCIKERNVPELVGAVNWTNEKLSGFNKQVSTSVFWRQEYKAHGCDIDEGKEQISSKSLQCVLNEFGAIPGPNHVVLLDSNTFQINRGDTGLVGIPALEELNDDPELTRMLSEYCLQLHAANDTWLGEWESDFGMSERERSCDLDDLKT